MARARRARSGLKTSYDPHALQGYDIKTLKGEYSRLRDLSRKRLERLAKGGYGDTEIYRRGKKLTPKIKQLLKGAKSPEASKERLAIIITDLKRWTESEYSKVGTLNKIRDKSIATLHEHGYNFINKSNWNEWTDFMEWKSMMDIDNMFYDGGSETGYREDGARENKVEMLERLFKEWRTNGGYISNWRYQQMIF